MNPHIAKCATLRGQGEYAEAVMVIEDNLSSFNNIERLPALVGALWAAEEGGLVEKAIQLAKLIAAEDPNVPSIQKYLR